MPSTSGFLVRRATVRDAPELARLRYQFRAELDPPREAEPAFLERCTRWMLVQLAPESRWSCWVAVLGSNLVGTLWLQFIEKLPNPVGHLSLHGYVSSLYVIPELRNAGIGSTLLGAGILEAKSHGVDALFLWPTDRSRSLYERHGFAVRDDLLEKRN